MQEDKVMVDPVPSGARQNVQPRGRLSARDVVRMVPAVDPAPIRAATLPKLMSIAAELAHQGPPIDYQKVAEIRAAIALGTYRINADHIALALLSFGRG
jgi:flagellar biosynthesis anti-sigma factor FlgM